VNTNLRTQLVEKFRSKEYRDGFVQEYIYSRIPLKIRAIRDKRKMSQAELGEKAGIAQAWVSKLENPSYGRLTLSTLLKVASAFDCGLSVDFVPYSRVLDEATSLLPASFDVPNFANDWFLLPEPAVLNFASAAITDTGQAPRSFVGSVGTGAVTILSVARVPDEQSGKTTGIPNRHGNVSLVDSWLGSFEGKGQQSLAHFSAPLGNPQSGGIANEALGSHLS
jgi:transcriptional regulator with XRE-family HTH domain